MPNLERARLRVESFMTDTCVITRDAQEVYDDIIDENTGLITKPSPDATTLYDGPCLLISAGIGQAEGAQGGAIELLGQRTYRGYLPLSLLGIEAHDILTVTDCLRDPELIGRRFIIRGVYAETFAIFRLLDLEGDR